MPDPATITKQKDAYTKMLDEQFKQGCAVRMTSENNLRRDERL
jgi:hypothetical protein